MEIEEALSAHLKAHVGLSALVSTRIYWDEAPQGAALPFVVALNISDVKNHSLTGQYALEQPIYQFTAYAETKAAAKQIAAQIKAALQDYSGVMSGVRVQYIQLLNELSTLETGADGTTKTYTTDLEFQVNFERST